MKQISSSKYSVAWFRLAEVITRKERERAFGMYKLLAHSLADVAFVHQLEGDMLCAFSDYPRAVQKYKEAARVYHESGRLFHAVAVYNHVLTIIPLLPTFAQEPAPIVIRQHVLDELIILLRGADDVFKQTSLVSIEQRDVDGALYIRNAIGTPQ